MNQKGFVPILTLILLTAVAVAIFFVPIPERVPGSICTTGIPPSCNDTWKLGNTIWENLVKRLNLSKNPISPKGCVYKEVQCIQAPCDPVLVCPNENAEPTPTVDETTDWKAYSTSRLSFKYPAEYVVKETDSNFYVILPNETTPAQYADIAIDARLTGNYASYENAVTKTQEGLTNKTLVNLLNGIRVSGEITGGIGGGRFIDIALFKYQSGAVAIEHVSMPGNISKDIFNKILSTFKFTQ